MIAILGHHLIGALHHARRRRELAVRGVLKRFAGMQERLLADDAGPADFLGVAGGVGDDPVAADQLDVVVAFVRDPNGIHEVPELFERLRPIGHELRFDFDTNVVRDRFRCGRVQRLVLVFHRDEPFREPLHDIN